MQRGEVWVFHRGALGDSVLLWPMLRVQRALGQRVVLVTEGSKAQLAAQELKIVGLDAEQPRFNNLWVPGASQEALPNVARVIGFAASTGDARGQAAQAVWQNNAKAMFPGATLEIRYERPDAIEARRWSEQPGGMAARRANAGGDVVMHSGAGAESKRWPLERFGGLADRLEARGGSRPLLIAGEVEAERFSESERTLFEERGGRFMVSLRELVSLLRRASLVIGCDSGPSHVSAQLGVPTLALFGPTDPHRWSPVGPAVRIIAPEGPMPMGWLDAARVADEAGAMLAEQGRA